MRRHSIRTLMAFVVVSAVGLAALRGANDLWVGMLLLVVLVAVGAAVLGAVILQGRERAWWVGFALFSGGYLALTFGPWLSDSFEPRLGTSHLLRYAYERTHASPAQTEAEIESLKRSRSDLAAEVRSIMRISRGGNDPSLVAVRRALQRVDQQLGALSSNTSYDDFRQVGHALLAPLAGAIGAALAVWFHKRRERMEDSSGPT